MWCGCGVGVVWVWCGCGVGVVCVTVPLCDVERTYCWVKLQSNNAGFAS